MVEMCGPDASVINVTTIPTSVVIMLLGNIVTFMAEASRSHSSTIFYSYMCSLAFFIITVNSTGLASNVLRNTLRKITL